MDAIVTWLETHDKLAGWAQFLGAMLALLVTYFTAFAPVWRRKRQLKNAATRLLLHGYEVIESYHRTSEKFLPFPLSLRQAGLSIMVIVEEMNRFPIYDLDDQSNRSVARQLVAMSATLNALRLFLDTIADNMEGREANEEDQKMIREFTGNQLNLIRNFLSGKEIKRPEWPIRNPSEEA
ncbi:hypothetical protein [Oceanibaculum pacificum]|uniref:hypothetical protein n=1 Tax=Oceanibaculum pacificum TaxID=580166 RepID=UPI0009FE1347|nr:hypothetical protein [Oceanibaculum pacificum]